MKKFLALAAVVLLPSVSRATSFGASINGISVSVGESKATQFDEQISRLIETVRTGTDRKARIDAVNDLAEKYSAQTSMDKTRIVDALIVAADDNDHGFRHYAVAAIGRVAEQSDDFTTDRIAQELGQRIENLRVRTAFTENGERADLLVAYARTAGRAHLAAGRHAEQFTGGVMDEVRESDSRGKTLAFRALNMFMNRGMNRIYSEKRELFAAVARDLIPMTADNDVTARSEYAKALVLLDARRNTVLIDDPALRQTLKDRLENMYNNEPDPTLKFYLGLHLGHRSL